MRSGVKIKDILVGTGDEAVRGKTVVANVRMFLNQGSELTGICPWDPRMLIDLGRRECIAGLRYGIEGMRIGGHRRLIISPHLAYGEQGIPGRVPPNAVICCEVELLEVREQGVRKPEDYPPGKHLTVFRPGESARQLPRWQFALVEDGHCGIEVIRPVPGVHWRHARPSSTRTVLDKTEARSLIREAVELPKAFPEDCLSHDQLWSDMTERGNAITRDRGSGTLCLTISVMERGEWICYYAIIETSRAMFASRLLQVVTEMVTTVDDEGSTDE